MPEEEFERDGFHKYIVYKADKQSNDLRMLAENQIEGVLTHELKTINGNDRLYYHIEGCQPVSVVFGQRVWDYRTLKNLFQAVCECIHMLREYLLPFDMLVLDPEHIYWSWQEERAKFLMVPDYEVSIANQLTGLVEYLMQHVDYEDKKATEWLYSFYDALRRQGASYALLCEYSRRGSNDRPSAISWEERLSASCDQETQQALQEMYYMDESKWKKRISKFVEWMKGIWKNGCGEEKGNPLNTGGAGQPSRSAQTVQSLQEPHSARSAQTVQPLQEPHSARSAQTVQPLQELHSARSAQTVQPLQELHSARSAQTVQPLQELHSAQSAQQALSEQETQSQQASGGDTVLLSEESNTLRLKPFDAAYPYIVPRQESMLIGRQEAACNYVLSCQDISRVHASVVLRDACMLVTDLNSSNGTYVNQKRLGIQEEMIVERGDEVSFGSVRYVAV